jgi:exonuclease VII small subunit
MTQLDESHDLLHAENKDRYYTQNKYINTLYSIVDKLEQRISKLERVLESHAKCIGEMRDKNEQL